MIKTGSLYLSKNEFVRHQNRYYHHLDVTDNEFGVIEVMGAKIGRGKLRLREGWRNKDSSIKEIKQN